MRQPILRTIATLALAAITVPGASATTAFPSAPVRLVVPYAAGGGMDVVARTIARSMSSTLGQPIVILNLPGAGTSIGASEVARAKADGHTILWGDNATYALNKFLYKQLPYDPEKSFTPISLTISGSVSLAVSNEFGVRSVPELLARLRAEPGKHSYGSAGNGSPHHLAMEKLKLEAGLDLTHVPYRGESPGVNDLMAGVVPLMFLGDTMARRAADSGKVRLLATAGPSRNPLFSDLPTIAEAGVPGYDMSFWHALAAPAGTPPDVIAKLNAAYSRAAADPVVKAFLATNNPGLALRVTSPAETQAFMRDQLQKARELTEALKLVPN